MKGRILNIVLVLVLVTLPLAATAGWSEAQQVTDQPALSQVEETPASDVDFKSSPVMFVENVGQWDSRARYQIRNANGIIWFAEDTIWLSLLGHAEVDSVQPQVSPTPGPGDLPDQGSSLRGVNIRFAFLDINPAASLESLDRLDTSVSYFLGSDSRGWHYNVPVWGGIRYRNLYPGVDLEVHMEGGHWIWRWNVTGTASLEQVRMRIDGAESVQLDKFGRMRLSTAIGEIDGPSLVTAHGISEVPSFVADNVVSFAAPMTAQAAADIALETSSVPEDDPGELRYSTFLGGSGFDAANAITAGNDGTAFVAGETYSLNFPTTPGAFDPSNNGSVDVFVTRLRSAGNSLMFSTYVGGTSNDRGYAIAVDATGSIYVAGASSSSNFPTTAGAFDTTYNGNEDVIAFKLNANGTSLVYSTYLGGSSTEVADGLAVDSAGKVYLAGYTASSSFPTTAGAFDTTWNGGSPYSDGFVTKFNTTGSALEYSTFLGGTSEDDANGIAVDAAGRAYVTGWTGSSNFPTTAGAFDTTFAGIHDVFITKLNESGSALIYSGLLGGSLDDQGQAIAIDVYGAAYVTGQTNSSNLTVTAGAFDTSLSGAWDGFVAKINPAGDNLVYSTYLGGSANDCETPGIDRECIIDVDGFGVAYVAGRTSSTDFPTTPNGFDTTYNGNEDGFIARLSSDGASLVHGSFFGGSEGDQTLAVAVDGLGSAYIGGRTYSINYPVSAGAFDTSHNGGADAFVTKLATGLVAGPPIILVHGWQGSPTNLGNPTLWRSCSTGIQPYNDSLPTHSRWGIIASGLRDAGYTVYIANLESSPLYTPPLEFNALCLRNQVRTVAQAHQEKVTLIGHSMGGLVSRAYIENAILFQDNVDKVITLGSPHGGVNYTNPLLLIYLACGVQPAACQFTATGMSLFNTVYNARAMGVPYSLIGGVWGDWKSRLIIQTDGPNDSVVGLASATGRYWPTGTAVGGDAVGRFQTYAKHMDEQGYLYDQATLRCIKHRLGLDGSCNDATIEQVIPTDFPVLSQRTEAASGQLSSGEVVSATIPIDTTGTSLFMLDWFGGALDFTLTNPSGVTITQAYAAANPSIVSYSEQPANEMSPAWAGYWFTDTIPGPWTLWVESNASSPDDSVYAASVWLETTRTLSAGVDAELYQAGDSAVITATLESNGVGIAGADVAAELRLGDGAIQAVALTDQGGGSYQATYPIPDNPGYVFGTVRASGSDGGTPFSRETDIVFTIGSGAIQLTGSYAERTVDGNGDGNFDALLIDIGIEATTQVTLSLSAALASPGITTTLTSITSTMVSPGVQTLTLSFPGRSIHRDRASGPYTVTDVLLQDFSHGGVVAEIASNVYTTQFYDFRQFGLRGDVDDSCEVDIQDVIGIASAWNTSGFDPVLDINRDGVVTVADVMLAAGNWGASCWQ